MRMTRFNRWVIGSLMGLLIVSSVQATTNNWNETAGGDFNTPANWTPAAVPGAGDLAVFDLDVATAYTVRVDVVNHDLGTLQLIYDKVVLDLDGQTLNLTDPVTGGTTRLSYNDFTMRTPLMIARGEFLDPVVEYHNASLTIIGGGTVNTLGLILAGTKGTGSDISYGNLFVRDGTTLNVNNTSIAHGLMSNRGNWTLHILEGSTVTFAEGFTDYQNTCVGDLLVEGSGSKLESKESRLFFRGAGTALIRDGALFDGGVLRIGFRYDQILTFDNATGLFSEFYFTGLGGSPQFGLLDVTNGSQVTFTGQMWIGSHNNNDPNLDLNVRGQNAVPVPSRLVCEDSIYLGGTDAVDRTVVKARLSVTDGGEAAFAKRIRFWSKGSMAIDDGMVTASEVDARAGAVIDMTLHTGSFGPLLNVTNNVSDATFNGDVILDTTGEGVTLNLVEAPGFSVQNGDVFTLLSYKGTLTGTFKDLPEDTVFLLADTECTLHYGTGSNSAITLRAPSGGTVFLVR